MLGLSPNELHLALEFIPLLLFGGALAGLLAGLFGVGGGTVLVPLLIEVLRLTHVPEALHMHLAVGTSLAVIIPNSIAGHFSHKAKGAVDEKLLEVWALPIIAGVCFGATIAAFSADAVLKIIFAVICVLTALRFFISPYFFLYLGNDMPQGQTLKTQGFSIGVIAALMGMGGGIFSNLLMTPYKRPIHQAVATSAGVGLFVSIPGALTYMVLGLKDVSFMPLFSIGYVSLLAFAILAPISAAFVSYGVKLAHQFSPRKLEIAFAIYLLLIAARIVTLIA